MKISLQNLIKLFVTLAYFEIPIYDRTRKSFKTLKRCHTSYSKAKLKITCKNNKGLLTNIYSAEAHIYNCISLIQTPYIGKSIHSKFNQYQT
jgi:hypothetical protein